MEIDSTQYEKYIFGFVAFVIIMEIILHLTWNSYYFKKGFTIFKFKLSCQKFVFPVEELNRRFYSYRHWYLFPSIIFHEISLQKIAFREKHWIPSTYIPMMHGHIAYDSEIKEIRIKFFFNASPFLMWGYAFVMNYFF